MKCVIMAGGRGTRISSVTKDIPKPMIKIGNKPVLEHQIENMREQGIKDIIITVGYLSSVIMDYFGDGGKNSPSSGRPFGVNIEYFVENRPLGNAGALFLLKDKLTEEFLLLNGDCIFDLDFKRFISYHRKKGGLVTLFTHPNSHPYDSGIIVTDGNGAVKEWITKEDERPQFYKNRVNAGVHIISKKILDQEIEFDKIDLDRHILKPLSNTGCMFAYDSSEYVKDMGTLERFESVCKDFKLDMVKSKNLKYKQKAIFIDRDGTLNKYVGFLRKTEELELLPGVGKALKKINASGYLAIVVTNQPVIARGEISEEELEIIHNKLETLLGEEGAYLDKIYFCPHHPDGGYIGERTEYKIICNCRKPNPGMLLKASEEFNIDLANSWIVGDSKNDMLAGKAAGCKTALIGNMGLGNPDICVDSLYDFTEKIKIGLDLKIRKSDADVI